MTYRPNRKRNLNERAQPASTAAPRACAWCGVDCNAHRCERCEAEAVERIVGNFCAQVRANFSGKA